MYNIYILQDLPEKHFGEWSFLIIIIIIIIIKKN
jgi:hypothetical protein